MAATPKRADAVTFLSLRMPVGMLMAVVMSNSSTMPGQFLPGCASYPEPLGANPRVGKIDEQITHGGAERAKRRAFLLSARFECGSVLRQFRVWQPGAPMVDAVIRFVEQREVQERGHPTLRHDASRRAVHRRAGEADMLHILAKALHVRGQPRREQMQPEEIFPRVEDGERRQDGSPDERCDRELRPNAPTQLSVPNG